MIASDNPIFAWIYKTLWSWGYPVPLKNKDGKYEGSPSPVYRNPAPLLMILFVIVNLVILAIILILYLNESVIKDTEHIDYPGVFFVGILFSGFNCKHFLFSGYNQKNSCKVRFSCAFIWWIQPAMKNGHAICW